MQPSARLERAKIEALTDAIQARVRRAPTVFKAGRYGFGPHHRRVLAELGYRGRLQPAAAHRPGRDGGPISATRRPSPSGSTRPGGLLEVPLTIGFFGAAPGIGRGSPGCSIHRRGERCGCRACSREPASVSRSRLTPEGVRRPSNAA